MQSNFTPSQLAEIQILVEQKINDLGLFKIQTVTVADVAAALNYKKETVQDWIKQGKLRANKIGNEYRILLTDVQQLINNYSTTAPLKKLKAA